MMMMMIVGGDDCCGEDSGCTKYTRRPKGVACPTPSFSFLQNIGNLNQLTSFFQGVCKIKLAIATPPLNCALSAAWCHQQRIGVVQDDN